MRVLVVDDSRAMRQYVKGVLNEFVDLRIEEVASGFEAFKVLARESFDVVVTDINMPDINGLDLVRHLKKTPRHTSCKIVIITTQATPKTKEKLLDLGVDGFVSKPFEPVEMTTLIGDLITGNAVKGSTDET